MTDTNATDAQEHQDDLTPEQHLENLINIFRQNNIDLNKGQYADLFGTVDLTRQEGRQNPTDKENCIHEIVIDVRYQIISVNNKQEELGCVEAIEDQYIIPIPAQEEYKPYVERFKTIFNESLVESAKDLVKKD